MNEEIMRAIDPYWEHAQGRHIADQAAMTDPRIAQLVEFFKASAEADKVLLIQIAKLHADRNQGRKS